jgi:hypothetical protein
MVKILRQTRQHSQRHVLTFLIGRTYFAGTAKAKAILSVIAVKSLTILFYAKMPWNTRADTLIVKATFDVTLMKLNLDSVWRIWLLETLQTS